MADPIPREFPKKRRVLYAPNQQKAQEAAARALVKAGRLSEALEFLERWKSPETLEAVRREAVGRGDTFALQRVAQMLRIDPDPSEWRAVAAKARAEERHYDAIRALEKAGDMEESEALRLEKHPGYVPFRPQGK